MSLPSWFTHQQLRVPQVGGTRALLDHHGVSRRGVLHVGAHHGQELEHYLACGFATILYLEANPDVFPQLEAHVDFWREWMAVMGEQYDCRQAPRLDALCCAASDREGRAAFHLTECDGRGSLLDPVNMPLRGEIEVPTHRLDDLVAQRGASFSLLTIDVQGAELRVLSGAPELLQSVEMVVLEVNFQRRYKGCALADEVETFMEERGYRAVARAIPHGAIGGNVAYLRQRQSSAT